MRLLCLIPVLLLAACATTQYPHLTPSDFASLATAGCQGPSAQFRVSAHVSAAYKDSIVLWNGSDPELTATVSLPRDALGELQTASGKLDALRSLRSSREPALLALQCEQRDRAPRLLALSYRQQGRRETIEFRS